MKRPWYILPLIVGAQFSGTSLWFAGTAILQTTAGLQQYNTALLTSAVQAGFIIGTLLFSLLSLADRLSPSLLFFVCSVLAALSNAALALLVESEPGVYGLRLATGFFLAGIYPVGMKIAADWYEGSLGKALGYLVGALVLGTAFPHLLKGSLASASAPSMLLLLSALAFSGGLFLWLLVPNGPYRKQSTAFQAAAFIRIFKVKKFRSAAFGYFGHMWELYTFWAFLPLLLKLHHAYRPEARMEISFWAFIIIGLGSIGCIVGGSLSKSLGNANVAATALTLSGLCCIFCPFAVHLPTPLFLIYLSIWGITIVADSPQFSALAAQTAPPANKGTALTVTTCIGFSLTIISIQLMQGLMQQTERLEVLFALLFIGPLFGLWGMRRLLKNSERT